MISTPRSSSSRNSHSECLLRHPIRGKPHELAVHNVCTTKAAARTNHDTSNSLHKGFFALGIAPRSVLCRNAVRSLPADSRTSWRETSAIITMSTHMTQANPKYNNNIYCYTHGFLDFRDAFPPRLCFLKCPTKRDQLNARNKIV